MSSSSEARTKAWATRRARYGSKGYGDTAYGAHAPSEVELLRARLAESEAENDQWQKKVAELWVELAALRALVRPNTPSV